MLKQSSGNWFLEFFNFESNNSGLKPRKIYGFINFSSLIHFSGGSGTSSGGIGAAGGSEMGVIPAQTQLLTSLSINTGTPSGGHVEVTLTTSNDTVIRGVLIFAEVIHNKFSHSHQSTFTSSLSWLWVKVCNKCCYSKILFKPNIETRALVNVFFRVYLMASVELCTPGSQPVPQVLSFQSTHQGMYLLTFT